MFSSQISHILSGLKVEQLTKQYFKRWFGATIFQAVINQPGAHIDKYMCENMNWHIYSLAQTPVNCTHTNHFLILS